MKKAYIQSIGLPIPIEYLLVDPELKILYSGEQVQKQKLEDRPIWSCTVLQDYMDAFYCLHLVNGCITMESYHDMRELRIGKLRRSNTL